MTDSSWAIKVWDATDIASNMENYNWIFWFFSLSCSPTGKALVQIGSEISILSNTQTQNSMSNVLFFGLVLGRLGESDTQRTLPSYLILQSYTSNTRSCSFWRSLLTGSWLISFQLTRSVWRKTKKLQTCQPNLRCWKNYRAYPTGY